MAKTTTKETTSDATTEGTNTMKEQMESAAAETSDATATAAEAPAGGPADLTVQDLQALKVIIDVASQRGAFRPNEMTTVGATYTKLEQFLAAIAASQQAQAAATVSGAAEGTGA